ncbi:MAG: 7-carboxy-7-deazaguanine synthase QueE [Betaproteobacteria bacterium]
MDHAYLNEIFASIQGEGPRIGQRHIFVRFQGCDIRCRYCDTPAAAPADKRLQCCASQASTGPAVSYEQIPNPVSASRLTELCNRLVIPGPAPSTISLTGGEPLLQYEFLAQWLPIVKKKYRIYLETNGIHDEAMKALNGLVDMVSMDFKLPSATGLRPFWEEHKRFLSAAVGTEIFIKAVVTRDTNVDDILESSYIIAGHNASIPFILQPAGNTLAPDVNKIIDFQDAALRIIRDVRVIPQVHTILKVP